MIIEVEGVVLYPIRLSVNSPTLIPINLGIIAMLPALILDMKSQGHMWFSLIVNGGDHLFFIVKSSRTDPSGDG